MAADQTVEIRKHRAFSAVPDDILTDTRLSPLARLILAYTLGRPAEWVLYVSHLRGVLGVKEAAWARASQELKNTGYFVQVRGHDSGGKIVWTNIITDSPAVPSTIPRKTMYGSTGHGGTIHGKPGYIAKDLKQAAALKSSSSFIVDNEQDQLLLDALIEQHGIEAVEAEAKALIKAGKRPYSSNLKKSLSEKAAAARRLAAEERKAAALATSAPADEAARAAGEAVLAKIRRKNSLELA